MYLDFSNINSKCSVINHFIQGLSPISSHKESWIFSGTVLTHINSRNNIPYTLGIRYNDKILFIREGYNSWVGMVVWVLRNLNKDFTYRGVKVNYNNNPYNIYACEGITTDEVVKILEQDDTEDKTKDAVYPKYKYTLHDKDEYVIRKKVGNVEIVIDKINNDTKVYQDGILI
jgi:hypothetical protein